MATAEQQLAQVMQQVAQMQDRLQNLQQQLGASQSANGQLQKQLREMTNRMQSTGASSEPRDARGGLFDKKLYEPGILEDARDFKEWSDDFYDWVEMCDDEIPSLLIAATREKDQITALGSSEGTISKAKPLFRMMKRFIKLKPARQTVALAPGKNPYEAWRLLFAKLHPKNDATAGAVVIRLCDWEYWKCRVLADVPLTISQSEKLQDDYEQ